MKRKSAFPKLRLPKPEVFDPGALRYGDACLTAEFPQWRKAKRNFWRAAKLAAVLAVLFDFLTPDIGIIGGAFDPAVGEAHAAGTLPANVFQYTPVTPTGPTSTTPTMMGIGLSNGFVPHYDGVALISISGVLANSTAASDGAQVQIVYGTGTAPVNGATFTGTACGGALKAVNGSLTSNVSNQFPFTVTCIATGLVLSTGYWIDLAASQVSAGTVTLTNVNVVAVEQ